jgi:hypothetical protein
MPNFVVICPICNGTGRIHFRSVPSDEWIPCVCQDPYEEQLERATKRAERYLDEREGDGTMSEMLAECR